MMKLRKKFKKVSKVKNCCVPNKERTKDDFKTRLNIKQKRYPKRKVTLYLIMIIEKAQIKNYKHDKIARD